MGRPLNKKYFGNRNIGTGGYQVDGNLSNSQEYADDRIGGEGIADVTIADAGNWLATAGGSAVPISGLSMPAPSLPGGVTATWDVTYGIEHVTTGAGHTGLIAGETYTSPSFPGSIITVATVPGSGNATFTVTNQGATGTLPTDLQGVNITLRTGQGHTGVSQFLVDIFTHIKGVSIGEKGSGYTGAESITVTLANGATGSAPSGFALVLTQDTGAVGSATNQENAIIINANTDDNGSKVGDIIKQSNARSYKVKTADGIAICKLVDTNSLAYGEAFIKATDDNGNTYFVTKLTGHKATLMRWNNNEATWLFDDGQTAPWTFDSTADGRVIIENA